MSGLCILTHGTDRYGTKIERETDAGFLCRGHYKKLREWIRDIAVDFALLDTRTIPGVSGDGSPSAKGFESAPPMNLQIAALRDTDRGGNPRERGDELWYELPDVPSVVAVIHAEAENLRNHLDPTHEPDPELKDVDLTTETRFLLAGYDTLVTLAWIDETFTEIKRVWVALQNAHDRPRPKALGHCLTFDCDGLVWPRDDAAPWCSSCNRVFESTAEWTKIKIQEEQLRADRKKANTA